MDAADAGRQAGEGVTYKDWPADHDWRRFDSFMIRSIGQHAGHARRDIADLVAYHRREMEISLDRAELAWRRERMGAVLTMDMLCRVIKAARDAQCADERPAWIWGHRFSDEFIASVARSVPLVINLIQRTKDVR